jgi:HupE / UreJ protein
MSIKVVLCRLALLLAALTFLAVPASAHDIPSDVTVQAFVKPEGHSLRLLVRLPLKAVMDVEFPRRERDYVDLAHIDQSLRDAATLALSNNLDLYEGDTLLASPRIVSARMSLESDRSFATYEQALAHVTGPVLPQDTTIFWEQGILDVLFEYPIQSDRSYFSIHAAFDRFALKVVTALQFLPPGGIDRAYELEGDAGLVRLDPNWFQAAGRFVTMGFFHILDGTDHLLFLLCLLIPFRRVRPLIPIVTAFTVAHSVTLIASAYNYAPDVLWFPPLIETLIATSVFYMALENIVVAQPGRRWIITFLFGLVHGFGFSFGLQHTLQFAGSHLLTSLLSFNIGVELGQLLVLAVLVPLLNIVFRYVVAERMGTIILSAIVAHTAWHWMTERFDVLRQFPWPTVTAAGLATGLRWLIVLVALAAMAWLLLLMTQRTEGPAVGETRERRATWLARAVRLH